MNIIKIYLSAVFLFFIILAQTEQEKRAIEIGGSLLTDLVPEDMEIFDDNPFEMDENLPFNSDESQKELNSSNKIIGMVIHELENKSKLEANQTEGDSNLFVKSSSFEEIDLSNNYPLNGTLLYKIQEPTIEINYSNKSKILSIITLIIFGFAYMFLKLIYSKLKNINIFFSKCMQSLSNQMMFMVICLLVIILFYTGYRFDSIEINWQYYIAGLSIFLLCWFIYNIYISFISVFFVKNWELMEANSNSFTNLRHKYDEIVNNKYDPNNKENYNESEAKKITQLYQYLVLKRFFFIPLFPVFKASSLRKEMNFSVYLKYCLLENIKNYFKFSWTGWIIMIIVMMFWNVLISYRGPLFLTIFLCLIPLLGIGLSFLLFLYLKFIFRKVVEKISQDNMGNYQDVEYNSNAALQSMGYPKYLLKLIQNEEEMKKMDNPSFTFHEHIHQRPPSLYEELIIFGSSGFPLIINLVQTLSLGFIAWLIVTFANHMDSIINKYSNFIIILFIIIALIYFAGQGFLSALTIKWFTIISSIEMRRSEKSIQKLINDHLIKSAEVSEDIYRNFKKIYFDMKTSKKNLPQEEKIFINQEHRNELKLAFPHLQEIIRTSVYRYKEKEDENGTIELKNELVPFLKSIGNRLNNKEIEFMLHLIQDFSVFKGELSIRNFFDIYGAILHFRTKKPLEIINYVFNNYYKSNPQLYKDSSMTYNTIELFMNTYHDFFTKKETDFMKEQCKYLGETFTIDQIMGNILSLRQYYPY